MEKRLSFAFLAAALLCFTLVPAVIVPAATESVTISLKDGSITLDAPYEITETTMAKDGGTIGIVVRDAKGISLPLCYDQRIKVPENERFVYVGSTYPTEASAEKVESGSDTEKALLEVLSAAKISGPHVRQDLVQAVIEKLRPRSKSLIFG